METINIFEWFLKTNEYCHIVNPVRERTLDVALIFSFTDYQELKLSNYQYIDGREIRFETHNIRKLKDKHEINISVYIDDRLVYFSQDYEQLKFY